MRLKRREGILTDLEKAEVRHAEMDEPDIVLELEQSDLGPRGRT